MLAKQTNIIKLSTLTIRTDILCMKSERHSTLVETMLNYKTRIILMNINIKNQLGKKHEIT
jgi:hypothetical protein